MELVKYSDAQANLWDEFVLKCPMSTFLHMRKFLSYHKNRFNDESLFIYDDKKKLVGIFVAASKLNDSNIVISHPGITYGGLIHNGKLIGQKTLDAFSALIDYYRAHNYQQMIYKAIPYIYQAKPSQDILYALFRHKADLIGRELSCTIPLMTETFLTKKARSKLKNMLRKTEKEGAIVSDNINYLPKLWDLLTFNLKQKYDCKPTHSLTEIEHLINLFPENILPRFVLFNDEVVAGTILFKADTVIHTQYLVVNEQGSKIFALDYLIQNCIDYAKQLDCDYFDFGVSTENYGNYLNASLYSSKAKHGGAGVVHDIYKIIF